MDKAMKREIKVVNRQNQVRKQIWILKFLMERGGGGGRGA